MNPSLVARYPDPPLTDGCICVTTLTTAGLARAAAWTMAESSAMVTPDRRFTDCGFVRDCSCRTPRLTAPATTAARTTTAAPNMTSRQGPRLAGITFAGRVSSEAWTSDLTLP